MPKGGKIFYLRSHKFIKINPGRTYNRPGFTILALSREWVSNQELKGTQEYSITLSIRLLA